LQQNNENLTCAISFNYNLVLENALKCSNISFSRIGTDEIPSGVSIYKPHGSIDFDLSWISIPIESRWTSSIIKGNDGGIVTVIPKENFHHPRVQADIVPPSVHNINLNLRGVNGLFSNFTEQASFLDKFLIVGSSYWEVDRPEINFFLERLPKKAIVYIMNPEPNEALIEKIESLGLSWKKFGFEELPW
jgi:hypothetical protein